MLNERHQYYTHMNTLRCYSCYYAVSVLPWVSVQYLVTMLPCYVLYLLSHCYDSVALITPNYQYREAWDMYKRDVLTLLR